MSDIAEAEAQAFLKKLKDLEQRTTALQEEADRYIKESDERIVIDKALDATWKSVMAAEEAALRHYSQNLKQKSSSSSLLPILIVGGIVLFLVGKR